MQFEDEDGVTATLSMVAFTKKVTEGNCLPMR